ncbi:DUF58 domain-containing protein [Paracoccus suum]|uniref:DUF58 domain-containing protein n=1 Tax=Paracoccus suum TaxID=2259340 RepID=A0A344PM20_9RHOB|nr:DUF58 domain-containing protein [Paracoccus suum]AXC50425.1 DUF58 domain-containing protein [Paracoccus suum]
MSDLRARAEAEAEGWPALVLAAERLAAQALSGAHGLRRVGPGEEFWQYRPATQGDSASAIDWRRSARGDADFVRDRERLSPQAAALWVAGGADMDWRGGPDRPTKADRARLIALTMAVLLLRGGERVGVLGASLRPGRTQLPHIAQALMTTEGPDPDPATLRPGFRALLIGDWLGPLQFATDFLGHAAALGVKGAILQVLDPAEEAFPFDGAVLFRDPSGSAAHDTRDAGGLRGAYLARLAARRAELARAADAAGWRFGTHSTDVAPSEALLWLSGAMAA